MMYRSLREGGEVQVVVQHHVKFVLLLGSRLVDHTADLLPLQELPNLLAWVLLRLNFDKITASSLIRSSFFNMIHLAAVSYT